MTIENTKTDVPEGTPEIVPTEPTLEPKQIDVPEVKEEPTSPTESTVAKDVLSPEELQACYTGHAGADAAMNILLETVDMEFINKHIRDPWNAGVSIDKFDKAALAEKIGADKATLVLAGLKEFYNESTQAVQELDSSMEKAAGSPEILATLLEWAGTKAKSDPAFNKEALQLNAMLASTPYQAGLAINRLKALYEADPNTSGLNNKLVQGDSAAGTEKFDYIDKYTAHKLAEQARRAGDIDALNRVVAQRAASARGERKN